MSIPRGDYLRRFNDLIAAVSDGSKEEARSQLRYLVNRILEERDEYHYRRLVDDIMVAWYDTKKGRGPWLPREVAGLERRPPS